MSVPILLGTKIRLLNILPIFIEHRADVFVSRCQSFPQLLLVFKPNAPPSTSCRRGKILLLHINFITRLIFTTIGNLPKSFHSPVVYLLKLFMYNISLHNNYSILFENIYCVMFCCTKLTQW